MQITADENNISKTVQRYHTITSIVLAKKKVSKFKQNCFY